MRFRRLDLIRYGIFTDRSLDLPAGQVDFHLIYGLNEAGKSTARDAVDDLLFGFGLKTQYDFRFDMSSLRVGGELERDNESLAFQRKKGNKDTLRDPNDQILPDASLVPFLGDADRDFFGRMFSLDHERLRLGGKEILEAKDDVGRMLFEAGAGITGLGEALTELEDEAKGIYGRRAAAGRTYYVARNKFDEAKNRLRDTTVNAREWKRAATELETIENNCDDLTEQVAVKSADREKHERIRRVLPILAEFNRCNAELHGLGEVTDLPDNADQTLADAETDIAGAKSRLESATSEIEEATKQLDELAVDETLILREAEISALKQENAVIEKNLRDIPNRQSELESRQNKIQALLHEIGQAPMSLDQLATLLPARAAINKVRSLIETWGSLENAKNNANQRVQDRETAITRLQEKLDEVGAAADTKELSATLRFAREKGDLRGEVENCQARLSTLNDQIEAGLLKLTPWKGTAAALKKLPVPHRSQLEQFEAGFGALDNQGRSQDTEARAAHRELNEQNLIKEQTVRSDHAIAEEAVSEARQRRDLGWSLVRRKHIDGKKVPSKEIKAFASEDKLADSFEQAIQDADVVLDQRFEQAEASARLIQIDHRIEQLQSRLNTLGEESKNLDAEQAELLQNWNDLWQPCKFEPNLPSQMSAWLEERDRLLKSVTETDELKSKIDQLTNDSSIARQGLLDAVVGLNKPTDRLDTKPLAILIEEADALQSQLGDEASERRNLENQLGDNRTDLENDKLEAANAQKAVEDWDRDWKGGLSGLGQQADEDIDGVRTALEIFEELREEHAHASDLSERIEKMQNDNESFKQTVINLANELAPDLAELAATDVVLELAKRLEEMKEKRAQTEALVTQKTRQEENLKTAEQDLRTAKAKIDQLLKISECDEVEPLWEAIRKSSRKRELVEQTQNQIRQLGQAGDGKSIDELGAECEGVDPDSIPAKLEELNRDLAEINTDLQNLSAARVEAKAQLDAISGGADAANAAEDKQQALAEMESQAERYVRVQSASMLLRWAIDRYRKETQAPLLSRAGTIFRTLTVDGFDSLTVDCDDKDRPQITGIRPDGSHVGVGGMSDGTTDQLYLALRIAAVEEYLEKAAPLPFIADDLFINFDDSRATAGLEVLAGLAKNTQVLFFTHHQHLLELAKKALGSDRMSVHQL